MASKTARLETRITADLKALVDRAAAYEGRTVSEFVANTVQQAARAVIEERELLRLNRSQSRKLVERLLRASPPNEALRQARDSYHQNVTSR